METIFRRSCGTSVFEINSSPKDLNSGYSRNPSIKLMNLHSKTTNGFVNEPFYNNCERGKNNSCLDPLIYKNQNNKTFRETLLSNGKSIREFTEIDRNRPDYEKYTFGSFGKSHTSKLPVLNSQITKNIKPKEEIHWSEKYMKMKEKRQQERKSTDQFVKTSLLAANRSSLCKNKKLSPIASASISSADTSSSSSFKSSNSLHRLKTYLVNVSVVNICDDTEKVSSKKSCRRVQSESATLPSRRRNHKLLHSTHSSLACPTNPNPQNPDQLSVEWWKEGTFCSYHEGKKKHSFPAEDFGKPLDLDLHSVNQLGGPDSAYSSLNRKSPVGGEQEKDIYTESSAVARFCHECGAKYPVIAAKFCCQCGVRRLAI